MLTKSKIIISTTMRFMLTIGLLLSGVMLTLYACGSSGEDGASPKGGGSTIIGQHLPFADPYILLHEDIYYAYGTSSDSGFEVYLSKDLKYWQKHNKLILHKDDSYAQRWFWAPEVYYNSAQKRFYLFYSADEHICVATGDSPLGPFSQEVKEPMRSEKAIDSSLFIDDDGTPYIFFVRFTNGNVIWAAQLESDLMTIKEQTLVKCFEVSQDWERHKGRVVEGPSVVKRNGIYYMIYSANDYTSPEYGVGYATANSPLGTWSKSENNPIFHRPHPDLVGTGHGAPFIDRAGNLKYVFHAHSNSSTLQPRKLYITDMAIGAGAVTISKSNIIFPKITN